MHAGVRPATGVRGGGLPRQRADCPLQRLLDCAVARLSLPTVKFGAVVTEDELDVPDRGAFGHWDLAATARAAEAKMLHLAGSRFRCSRTSAICTALVAAPFRRLSATTQRLSP